MPEAMYRATLSQSQGRAGWCVIFRHPLRRNSQGKLGLRIRRGLGSDEQEAGRLLDQMNDLLSNEALWTPGSRETAVLRYDPRIVAAFYDNLEPLARDPWRIRDEVIALPSRTDGYCRVMLVGTTGGGKTTLIRQLIGTDPKRERFPSTSAAKTTTADLEIVLQDDWKYRAVVTFLPKDTIRVYVEECITAAVLASVEARPEAEVARKFLEHREQRFRLNYLLGNPRVRVEPEDDVDDVFEIDDESDGDKVSEETRRQLTEQLDDYMTRIPALAALVRDQVRRDLEITPLQLETGEDRDAFNQLLLEDALPDREEFYQLVDDILDGIEGRFEMIERGVVALSGTWASHWTFETEDRNEFIRTINRFSSNYAPNFGRLLTPLVEGIRVSGPFSPDWSQGPQPRLVLLDGEGLGHTPDSSTTMPTRITKKYDVADAVVLVDNAAQPMQAVPLEVLKSLVRSGHDDKLIICYTHFDDVKGDNLQRVSAKKDHLRNSLDNALADIGKAFGHNAEMALTRAMEHSVIYLSSIDEPVESEADKGAMGFTRRELLRLIELIQEKVLEPEPTTAVPVYDATRVVLSVVRATQDFHDRWQGLLNLRTNPSVRPEHWTRIKALSRRFAERTADEYDTLQPVADLIKRLSEHIRLFLSTPEFWDPENAPEEMKHQAISNVAKEVSRRVHLMVVNRLFAEPVHQWNAAYEHRGGGSTRERAKDIEGIYADAAPVPSETIVRRAPEFLQEVRSLVREALAAGGGRLLQE